MGNHLVWVPSSLEHVNKRRQKKTKKKKKGKEIIYTRSHIDTKIEREREIKKAHLLEKKRKMKRVATGDEIHNGAKSIKQLKRFLTETNFNVNTAGERGELLIHYAAIYGLIENVKYLVSCGSAIDQASIHGTTPLMLAASLNKIEVVDFLIRHNADVNQGEMLKYAILEGDVNVARLLVDAGVHIHEQAEWPWLEEIRIRQIFAVKRALIALSFICKQFRVPKDIRRMLISNLLKTKWNPVWRN